MAEIKEFLILLRDNRIFDALTILFMTWLVATLFSRFLNKRLFFIPKDKTLLNPGQRTKMRMGKRLVTIAIYFFGINLALLSLESYKPIATALLASAGFVTSIAGFAARETVANLVAGITIAFAQPIRLHDYVKIDNEFGQVEELTLLHTIIRTWDNRDLVVPNAKIISSPVRNYSLQSPDVLTEAIIPVPYGTDIAKAKAVIISIIKNSEFHEALQEPEVRVYELEQDVIQLRVTALAKDAKSSYALSTEVKEKVVVEFPRHSLALGKISTEPILN